MIPCQLKKDLLLSFQRRFHYLFIVRSQWLGIPILCWIKVANVGILVLFLVVEEMLLAFYCWEWTGFEVIIHILYYIEVCSLCTHFAESFHHKSFYHRILLKVFPASTEVTIWFLLFNLLMWCISLIDFQIFTHSYICGINPTWSWYIILLMCCWIYFANILFKKSASMLISDTGV